MRLIGCMDLAYLSLKKRKELSRDKCLIPFLDTVNMSFTNEKGEK